MFLSTAMIFNKQLFDLGRDPMHPNSLVTPFKEPLSLHIFAFIRIYQGLLDMQYN